jgi:hypothetical protein
MHEVLFLIGRDGEVLWQETGPSAVALPDSRGRWEAIWRFKDAVVEIAHSHPVGPLGFSAEDRSTMSALCDALGRRPRFSVVAPDGVWAHDGVNEGLVEPEPAWALLLRVASKMPPRQPKR